MPNVNYRGKPSQDPNVPPELGVTSIPLGAPWPPLSREQVVKLHEALIEFLKAPMVAPNRLAMKLLDLGIGSPPPTRTWTHEEVAKVAEEVQQDRFGHITDLSRHSKPREEPTTDEDSGPGAMSWQRAEEFGSPLATEQPIEAPKRNCGTCRNCNWPHSMLCAIAAEGTPQRRWRDANWVQAKNEATSFNLRLFTADGCPGWERKP